MSPRTVACKHELYEAHGRANETYAHCRKCQGTVSIGTLLHELKTVTEAARDVVRAIDQLQKNAPELQPRIFATSSVYSTRDRLVEVLGDP